jgi:flavorubredoxin
MQTTVDEVAADIYRISTDDADSFLTACTVNQFLIDAEEPLLFSTGPPALFPVVAEAVDRVLPRRRIRWISSGHASRSDEFGSLDQWLATAPGAEVAHGERACRACLAGAERPPRLLADGEVLDLGGRRVRYLDAPFAQGPWECGFLYEETTRTLFCGDLFAQAGRTCAITGEDIVAPALALHDRVRFIPVVPSVLDDLHRLAGMRPATVAPMHGACYRGDGAGALRALAAGLREQATDETEARRTLRHGRYHEEEQCKLSN